MENRCLAKPRGFALIMVLVVVGLAAVLGYAMLASASMSVQLEKNVSASAQAESLAESGVNLAMYYLNYPQFAPSTGEAGYWTGGTNVSLGGTSRIDEIRVERLADEKMYAIVSRASVNGVTQSSVAQVYVKSEFKIDKALYSNGDLDFRATVFPGNIINGKVRALGHFKSAVALTTNTLEALGSDLSAWTVAPAYPARAAPLLSEIKIVSSLPYYSYNGQMYLARELTSDVSGTLPAPGASNPANVYYSRSTRKFNANTTLNGTLIVLGSSSDLEVNGSLTVTPKPGMPGIITQRRLKLTLANSVVSVNGLVWIGDRLESATPTLLNAVLGLFQRSRLTVNGSLMLALSDPDLVKNFQGEFDLKYVSANVAIPDFSSYGVVPQSVKVLSWK